MKRRAFVCRAAVAGAVLALAACGASAGPVFTIDFEDGNNPLSGGGVDSRFAHSGTNSLHLAADANLISATLALPHGGSGGTLSMWVYDIGKWVNPGDPAADPNAYGTCYGPRWGFTDASGDDFGISIINRTSLGCVNGYGYMAAHNDRFASWHSPYYFGGPRQCTLADEAGAEANSFEGTGQWSKWVFVINADGSMTISLYDANEVFVRDIDTLDDVNLSTFGDAVTEMFLYGGRADRYGVPLGGVWVDDIVWVPEPATLALLGVGGVWALVRRRRRR